MRADIGIPVDRRRLRWPQSGAGNPPGSCAGVAALASGTAAVRDSRHPAGSAPIYIRK